MVLDERSDQLISQPQVQCESWRNFPVVLEKEALLPVVDIHRRPWSIDVGHTGGRQSHDEFREWICHADVAGVGHRTSRVPAVHSETIDGGVAHEVGAHLEVVLADYPCERVSKRGKVLV